MNLNQLKKDYPDVFLQVFNLGAYVQSMTGHESASTIEEVEKWESDAIQVENGLMEDEFEENSRAAAVDDEENLHWLYQEAKYEHGEYEHGGEG